MKRIIIAFTALATLLGCARVVKDVRMKEFFYPDLDKSVLFEHDYGEGS